jgi:hypothetical protein
VATGLPPAAVTGDAAALPAEGMAADEKMTASVDPAIAPPPRELG